MKNLTSNMEGAETQQRVVAGKVPGLSMCPEAVAKSTWMEGQIFISLFPPCLVRPCRCPFAEPGARTESEAHGDTVLQGPVGSMLWASIILDWDWERS